MSTVYGIFPDDILSSFPPNLKQASDALSKNVYDTSSWMVIMRHYNSIPTAINDESRLIFNTFLKYFPTAADYWRFYLDKEIEAKNWKMVDDLFSKCLPICLDVELYRTYIRYQQIIKRNQTGERAALCTAFEFTLEHVGIDFNSSQIWMDYINFLSASEAVNMTEENEKLGLIRKVYQRAIAVPLSQTESIWKNYETWEHRHYKDLATNTIALSHPVYLKCLNVKRELKKKREGLLLEMLAKPTPSGRHAQARDYRQVLIWQRLLTYELGNPLRLDAAVAKARIQYYFRQCLCILRFYPQIWNAYAMFMDEKSGHEDAVKVFEQSLEVMADVPLMHFLYADFQERKRNLKEARQLYENLYNIAGSSSPLCAIELLRYIRRTEGSDAARKKMVALIRSPNCTYHLFCAAALMEYHIDNDPVVASNIFNLGMKKFSTCIPFLCEYLDFLYCRNDHQNMRLIFEQCFRDMSHDIDATPIYDRYVQLEQMVSDFPTLEAAEQRRDSILAKRDSRAPNPLATHFDISCVIGRRRFQDLSSCTEAYRNAIALGPSLLESKRSISGGESQVESELNSLPKPDIGEMCKVLENGNPIFTLSLDIGPALRSLLLRLPGSSGPDIIHIDRLMSWIMEAKPKIVSFPTGQGTENGIADRQTGIKRDASDMSSASHANIAPVTDLYRMRQAKKMAKAAPVST